MGPRTTYEYLANDTGDPSTRVGEEVFMVDEKKKMMMMKTGVSGREEHDEHE